MTEQSSTPARSDHPPQDLLLEALASLANDTGLELSVTIAVPGATLTGMLTSYHRWLEVTTERLTAASAEVGPALLKPWLDEEREYQNEVRDDETAALRKVSFLHLRDARVVDPTGTLPTIDVAGIPWRGRIDMVGAWALGGMHTQFD